MNLFIVRHGETKENEVGILMGHHQGILTEKGKQQARETAQLLKNERFTHIYSSDLARCVDTAEFIKEFHPDTPLTFTKELRERNLGVLQGQLAASIDWDSFPGDWNDKKPENGESFRELSERALKAISELYKKHPDDTLLLISHNGWIRQVIAHFAEVPSKDIPKVDNAQVIKIEVGKNLSGTIRN